MGLTQVPLTIRRWQRAEYDRLVGLGVFEGERIELLGGDLLVAEPQGAYHASAVSTADYALRSALLPGWTVRIQAPVSLDDESEPEPDLAVVPGRPRDYRACHPARPALAVEVAESSVEFDRARKGSLYARAGIEHYWIVNLPERALEMYAIPALDPSAAYGWRYGAAVVLAPPAVAPPLAFMARSIPVADLLP